MSFLLPQTIVVLVLIFPVRIPQSGEITINGHQSKILVTDFRFGSKSLLYSTAEVLTFAVFGDKEVLVLWLPKGETGEFILTGHTSIEPTGEQLLNDLTVVPGEHDVTVSYTQEKGLFTLALEDGSNVLLLDRSAAYLFWVPPLSNDPHAPENNTGK